MNFISYTLKKEALMPIYRPSTKMIPYFLNLFLSGKKGYLEFPFLPFFKFGFISFELFKISIFSVSFDFIIIIISGAFSGSIKAYFSLCASLNVLLSFQSYFLLFAVNISDALNY